MAIENHGIRAGYEALKNGGNFQIVDNGLFGAREVVIFNQSKQPVTTCKIKDLTHCLSNDVLRNGKSEYEIDSLRHLQGRISEINELKTNFFNDFFGTNSRELAQLDELLTKEQQHLKKTKPLEVL